MGNDLSGKTFVVTGATSGIGLAAAELIASQGGLVIGSGRAIDRCRTAETAVKKLHPSGQAVYLTADLALQSQVRELALQIGQVLTDVHQDHLDGLIHCAGTFTYWMSLTPEGFETQWAVNHLAPFLLTHELLPLLKAAPSARVVTVSSGSHYGAHIHWDDIQLRRRYFGLTAYGSTKLCNVLFTQELNNRLGVPSTIRAFAADPGLVKTDMGFKGTPALVRWVWNIRRSGGISAHESARGVVFLAVEPSIQSSSEIYWKHGIPKSPSPAALDRQSARRLWDISARMCAIPQVTE